MVVVRVKGAIRMVSLGGTILYIFTEPVGRLTPLKTDVYPGFEIAPGRFWRLLKAYPDGYTRPWSRSKSCEKVRRC